MKGLNWHFRKINAKDRHVLAAAIKTGASVLVTDNLKDFPTSVCEQFEVDPKSADSFVADTIELAPATAMATIRKMRKRPKNPAITADALIVKCEKEAMPKTATLLLEYKAAL